MRKRSTAQINARTEMAKKVVMHHFGKACRHIEYKPAGQTNFVFEVATTKGKFIVRIGGSPAKLFDFLKEQWVTEKALEKGIPAPEIVEVGHEIIPLPYMLQKKVDGQEASEHPDHLQILTNLGKHAKRIHSISTSGFGRVFDWSPQKRAKKRTWVQYLEEELQASERIKFLQQQAILTKRKTGHLQQFLEKIKRWKFPPTLNHCDLRLKNVIVDPAGEILAIIDWENASSNVAPYWDLSLALHDLAIEGKHKFLEGYGLDFNEFNRNSYALTVFNLLNYVPHLHGVMKRNNPKEVELYKLRLNGSLDLFSL